MHTCATMPHRYYKESVLVAKPYKTQPIESAGERIKALRVAAGITQKELAKAIGVTQGAISQMERGDIKKLSGPVLRGMCRRLRTNGDYILDGRNPGDQEGAAMMMTTLEEAQLLEYFRLCDEADKAALMRSARLRAMDRQHPPKRLPAGSGLVIEASQFS